MKRHPLFVLFVLAVAIVASGVWYVSRNAKNEAPRNAVVSQPQSASAPVAAPDLGQGLDAQSASSPALAAAVSDAKLLFARPGQTMGKPIDRSSAEYIQVSSTGAAPIGRTAKLNPASFPALASLKKGDSIRIPLFDGQTVDGTVNAVVTDRGMVRLGGTLTGDREGTFSLHQMGGETSGRIMLKREARTFEVTPQGDGTTLLVEKASRDVVCLPLPRSPGSAQAIEKSTPQQIAVPVLNSRPTAICQIFIDFDGATVTDPDWAGGNTIVAPPIASLSPAVIQKIFTRVKEDYWPFNINITTDQAKYDAAPPGKRMRCIVTTNDAAADGAGGVAYLDSFLEAGTSFSSDIPCWVFNTDEIGVAEAISHEVGHTFNLNHDGREVPSTGHEEYYEGHGSGATSWCPIMGAGYYVNVTQWSKGEYQYANNNEDDLQFISSRIGTAIGGGSNGYMADDAGNNKTSATPLAADTSTTVVAQVGVIEKTADIDFYSFTTNGGGLVLSADGVNPGQNVDLVLEVLNESGGTVVSDNNANKLDASITANLLPGNYFVRVTATGAKNPFLDGYSNYASLGAYSITGTIAGITKAPLITSATTATGQVGTLFTYQITASGNPDSFGFTGVMPPGLSVDSATGIISGVPTAAGSYDFNITASNISGTGSRALNISIAPPALTLAQAVDFESITWTTAGSSPWIGETFISQDTIDAAQTGVVPNSGSAYLETIIDGPTTVKFYWKVSSQLGGDFLAFQIDGTDASGVAPISGDVDFTEVSVAIPAGTHTLHWLYRKDATIADGSDRGWVDNVRFFSTTAPSVTSSGTAPGVVGNAFSYKITGTNLPSTFSAGALPPGLKLDANTGLITGTPAIAGTTNVTVGAANNIGTGTKSVAFNILASSLSLADVLDNSTVTWSTGGDANWFPQTVVTNDGVDAAQSGPIGNSETTFVEATVPGGMTVYFRWKVDAAVGDMLRFYVNGIQKASITGATDWQPVSVFVTSPGVARWEYTKDASGTNGADAAYLDQVVITPEQLPVITSSTSASGLSATPFFYQIEATNSPTVFDADNLPDGLVIDTTSGAITGSPTFAGVFIFTVHAGNTAGDAFQNVTLTIDPSLADAVDQPGRIFTTSGDADWFPQTATTYDGTDAAQTDTIGNSKQETFSTIVTGPIDVSFRWKVSSEATHDELRFEVDGSVKGSISGEVDWQARIFTIPAGTHTVGWTYRKDPSAKAGQDKAWVDSLSFSVGANLPQFTSLLDVNAYIGRPFSYQIAASNSPTGFSTSNLPASLNLVGSVISGTPTDADEGTYRVLLSGTNATGTNTVTLVIHVVQEPSGADNMANATPLGGTVVTSIGTNVFATAEPQELNHAGRPPHASIWWRWTAPATGTVLISTAGSEIDTVLSVYKDIGSVLGVRTYENDDFRRTPTSQVRIAVVAGDSFRIAADGVNGATGRIVLNINYVGTKVFAGLVTDQNADADPGFINLNLTERRGFSGYIKLNGKRYTTRGVFNGENYSGAAIAGRTDTPATIHLHMALNSGAQEVSGSLTIGNITYDILAKLAMGPKDVPAGIKGAYTFVIEPTSSSDTSGPEGAGYGRASIDTRGKLHLSGQLGDGSPFNIAQQLSVDKSAPIFITPYKTGGVAAGLLIVEGGSPFSPLSCVLAWHKVATPGAALFPAGFDISTTLKGYHFQKMSPQLQVTSASSNVVATFTQADLASLPASVTFTLLSNNKIVPIDGLKLTIDTATGLFTGSFPAPGTGTATHFGGAIVNGIDFISDNVGNVTQKPLSRGAGLFKGSQKTGNVDLKPVPAVP